MKDYVVSKAVGLLILIYGATGVGKTTSILASLVGRIMYVLSESRNPNLSLEAVKETYGKTPEVKFKIPEGWEDLINFLDGEVGKEKLDYQNLVLDSFSHFINVLMKAEAEKETFEAGIISHKRSFTDQFRLDPAAYGGIAGGAIRICDLLGKLSQKGITVVCTALRDENPTWSYSLSEAPAFIGKAFPVNAPAFFDLIGRVRPRTDKDTGKVIYPPMIDFESDGSFLAKWTGKRGKTTSGPLDFKAILGIKEKGGK